MPSSHEGHAAAEVAGRILVMGGGSNRLDVELYDPAADEWKLVGTLPSRLAEVHAAALEGKIYLVGGTDGVEHLLGSMVFTPPLLESTTESECSILRAVPRAPPSPRSNMAVGIIDGIIYVVGGYKDRKHLNTNTAYDPNRDRWSERAPMPTAREFHGSNTGVVGGKLYVVGGNAGGYCSAVNEAFDAKNNTWSRLTPMPTPRCHLAVVAWDGLIYAIGGTNTSGTKRYQTVEVYDPATDSWATAAPMPTDRWDVGAAVLDGRIYVMGGLIRP